MDCLNSLAPGDELLMSFALDGEALPEEVRIHLEHCEVCGRRLAGYKQTTAYLVSHLYRILCPTSEQIIFYCAGLLEEEEHRNVANHVFDCPLCASEVAQTRSFLRMEDLELSSPSFSPRSLVRRIFATHVSRPQLQFAVRSGISETPWPHQYKAESVHLSLHLSRSSSGEYMLLGLLTSTNPAESVEALEGISAELHTAPLPLATSGDKTGKDPLLRSRVDELGTIVFTPLPVGEYMMIIFLPDRELVIEGLVIE